VTGNVVEIKHLEGSSVVVVADPKRLLARLALPEHADQTAHVLRLLAAAPPASAGTFAGLEREGEWWGNPWVCIDCLFGPKLADRQVSLGFYPNLNVFCVLLSDPEARPTDVFMMTPSLHDFFRPWFPDWLR